jgi:hypothetical protein
MLKTLATLTAILCAAPSFLPAQHASMNFFLTGAGRGRGADLGGLRGADGHCTQLAYAAGLGSDLTWRAYLSTQATDSAAAVNARERIGAGPWYNFHGALVARTVAELHSDSSSMNKETALTQRGETVNGRGDAPNQHDILTGSQLDGTAFPRGADKTCNNWTSSASGIGSARVGHHDRQGGGENPTAWNSAHDSRGCSQENLVATGGNGLFFCFGVR